jgi:hypothetical protein
MKNSTWNAFYNEFYFSVYPGAKIGSQEAFFLYACGPNYTSIMPCKYGQPVIDYSKYINKDILRCDEIRDLFMTKKEVDVGLLIVGFCRYVHWNV